MTRTEWINRCASRYIEASGIDAERARDFANTCADQQADLNGASGLAWDSPEDAADEDMSYWEDDE
jgi:hypothetical protein